MSSPVPTPPAPLSGPPRAPAVEFVAAHRGPVGIALVALGVLFLVAGGYCLIKGYGSPAPQPDGAPPDAPPAIALNPYQTEFLGGGITGLLGTAAGLVLGGGLLARLKPRTTDAAHHEARWLILLAGGLFGLALMFLGLWLLGSWFDVISKWVNERDASQAWKPLTALLVFLVGAGLAFAAVQPARAEERNNADLRRLCYGLNFGLSTVLLVVGLVVANIVVGLKLPAQLDTTDEGFYSLDPLTKEFVAGLTQDVTVYTNLREDGNRLAADVNRLLDAARQVNPARFKVRRVVATDKTLVKEIGEKFRGVNFGTEAGVLVATGPKETQYSFLRFDDLFTDAPRPGSREQKLVFQGESKLVNELLFLADNKARPVIYFTQGHGELRLERPAPGEPAGRTCLSLKDALLKGYVETRPLAFELNDPAPKVPDDAAMVVVADPTGPLPPPTLAALKAYMTTPRGGKPGRLLVLSSLHAKPGGREAFPNNLSELTAPHGVTIEDRVIYGRPPTTPGDLPGSVLIALTYPPLAQQRNQLAMALPEAVAVPTPQSLLVPAAPPGGAPAKASPLLVTRPDRPTWVEPVPVSNVNRAWADLVAALQREDADTIRIKQPTAKLARVVAAVSADPPAKPDEKETPRLVVFGFGESFADHPGGDDDTPVTNDLFVAAVNWLRDRPPAAAVAAKTYGEYRPSKSIGFASGFWLPVGGLFVVVIFLGLGVWSYRRK